MKNPAVLPWTLDEDGGVRDGRGCIVLQFDDVIGWLGTKQHVIQAVNSHDELVEALKEACDLIKDLVFFANSNGGEYPFREFEEGRAALAKVQP